MVKIRKAGLKDVDSLVDVAKEFLKEHHDKVVKLNPKFKTYVEFIPGFGKELQSFFTKTIKSKKGMMYLAENEGMIIGYILFFIKDYPPVYKVKKIGYISDLYVKKEFRDLKISSKLKNVAVKWFKSRGIKHFSIMVSSENKKARAVYEKWGFFDYDIEMRKSCE